MEINTTPTSPAPKAPGTSKPATAPRKTGKKAERTALKSICSSLKMDPKAARRKLRKAGLSFHGMRERWTFTDAQATRVREILKESDIERAARTAPKTN